MILNQPDFFARSATLDGAISDTDTQITLSGLSTRFTDAVAAGTVLYPIGPLRISDDDGFELIAITGHVSGTTFEVERGIQGTTEEAWGDGTAVRVVVTKNQLSPGDLLMAANGGYRTPIAYDHFNRTDRLIDGDFLPSGQQWENLQVASDPSSEDIQIVNGILQRGPAGNTGNNGSTWALFPFTQGSDGMYAKWLNSLPPSLSNVITFVPFYVDDDNYIRVSDATATVVSGGASTEIYSGVVRIGGGIRLGEFWYSGIDRIASRDGVANPWGNLTSEAETIITNATKCGFRFSNYHSKLGSFIIYA